MNIGDQRLRWVLARRIYRDSLFIDFAHRVNPPIHIIVERGRVTLSGAVRSQVEKAKAEHIARSTFGVFFVENKLRVGD
jgi:hyperosmotically inducible protein